MSNKLAGKKAVVTGGTHGMGLAIVRALLDGGAEVVLTGRNEQTLEQARTALAGRAAHVVRSDAASMADIAALADLTRQRLGRDDHVFVNHGIAGFVELAEVTEASRVRGAQPQGHPGGGVGTAGVSAQLPKTCAKPIGEVGGGAVEAGARNSWRAASTSTWRAA
ncbi:SDR family NAD(P)-dependent oxidoreductase [Nocardia sp. NPDC050406]|uniref:SDR family NAD(P)-dependent oxidoreductase n=1 Tax=Nocardia sp. NPDC050406 TaxID=3364318 RepID=UPI0037B166DD